MFYYFLGNDKKISYKLQKIDRQAGFDKKC